MMNETVSRRIIDECIVAVLMIDDAADAVPLAEALLEGGVSAMELTLRTPAALEALKTIKAKFPQMLVGAGTVIHPDQVAQVLETGADFAVAPGMSRRVVEKAIASGLPFAPGICTPSDIETALEYDCRLLKFFPAGLSGGLPFLRAIAAPYAHLNLRYIPLGGLSSAGMTEYLREPLVGAIGGSWLAPKELINAGNWHQITAAARHAVELKQEAQLIKSKS